MAIKKITVEAIFDLQCQLGSFGKVLDVGCGGRLYEKYIPNSEYIGIDVEQSGHDPSTILADLFFDGKTLPFESNSFDFIICTEVLEHAVDPEMLFFEIKRVLKANSGRALITVPSMWGEHEVPYDFRRYTSFGIRKICEDLNLEVIKYEKESPGVNALFALGQSEVINGDSQILIKIFAILYLKVSRFIFNALGVRMNRIYLSNLVVVRKIE